MSDDRCLCIRCCEARYKPGDYPGRDLSNYRHACEKCGNKRCPHHTDHQNACTKGEDMITPPAPMITAADLLKIPGLMRLFLNTFEDATGKDTEEDVAIALAATLIAWPSANKAFFAQGPHLMLPVPE